MKAGTIFIFWVAGLFSFHFSIACAPVTPPSLTAYVVSGNSLLLDWESTNVWTCNGYKVEVEFACINSAFSGTGPFYTSAALNKTVTTPMPYPQQSIPLSDLCPGLTYKFRAREVAPGNFYSNWTMTYTFSVPGTAVPSALTLSTTPIAICPNAPAQFGATLTACGQGGINYLWQPTANLSCTNCANPVVTASVSTLYTCTAYYTGQTACGAITGTLMLPINAITAPGTISAAPAGLCPGASAQLNVSSPGYIYQWEWSPTGLGNWTPLSNMTPSVSIGPLSSNMCYRVYSTGCGSFFSSNTVCVTAYDAPTLSISGPTVACEGEIFTLSAAGASTYIWNNGTAGPGLTTQQSLTSVYSVTGTASNGCTGTANQQVSYAACTRIRNLEADHDAFKILPNPTSGIAYVRSDRKRNLVVSNQFGQPLAEIIADTTLSPLPALLPGVYYVGPAAGGRATLLVVLQP